MYGDEEDAGCCWASVEADGKAPDVGDVGAEAG